MDIETDRYQKIKKMAREDLDEQEGFSASPDRIAIYSLNLSLMISQLNVGDYFEEILNRSHENDGSLVRRWLGLGVSELLTTDMYLQKIRKMRGEVKEIRANSCEFVLRAFDTIHALMDAQAMYFGKEEQEEVDNYIERARKNDIREKECMEMYKGFFFKICMSTNIFSPELMLDKDHELIKLRLHHHRAESLRISSVRLALELDERLSKSDGSYTGLVGFLKSVEKQVQESRNG